MLEKYRNTKFYLGWVKFCDDMRPMNWKQRLEYLWMYYKEYAYLAGIALVAVTLIVTMAISRSKETLVSGIMVNITIDPVGKYYMSEGYQNDLAPGDKWHVVELDYTSFGDILDPANGEAYDLASQILIARVSGQMLDYMILDKYAMEYYISQEVYLDLSKFFTEEEIAELNAEGRLIYAMQEGETERYAIAVDISDIPFVKDNITSRGETYFALSGNIRDLDACRHAWERLHAWESKKSE